MKAKRGEREALERERGRGRGRGRGALEREGGRERRGDLAMSQL